MAHMNFIRKRHVLTQVYDDGTHVQYKACDSVSQAKKLSRELQLKGARITVDHDDDPKPTPSRSKGDAADRFIAKKLREEQAEKVRQAQERKKGPNTISLSKSQERRLKVQTS